MSLSPLAIGILVLAAVFFRDNLRRCFGIQRIDYFRILEIHLLFFR